MKLTKEFLGVPDGEVHPRTYEPGDECPPELLEAAISLDAVEREPAESAAPVALVAPEPAAEAPAADPAPAVEPEEPAEQVAEVIETPAAPEEKADQPAENKATVAAPENKAAPAAKKGRAK